MCASVVQYDPHLSLFLSLFHFVITQTFRVCCSFHRHPQKEALFTVFTGKMTSCCLVSFKNSSPIPKLILLNSNYLTSGSSLMITDKRARWKLCSRHATKITEYCKIATHLNL